MGPAPEIRCMYPSGQNPVQVVVEFCHVTIGPPKNSPPGPNISEKNGPGGPIFSEKISPPLKNLVPPFFPAEIKGTTRYNFRNQNCTVRYNLVAKSVPPLPKVYQVVRKAVGYLG